MSKAKKTVKKNSVLKNTNKSSNEITNLIKLVGIIAVVILIFYFVTVFVTREKIEDNHIPARVQYTEILIGNILRQYEDEYYVLIMDRDDLNVSLYNFYLSNYSREEDSLPIYFAFLNNPFNDVFWAEESVTDITNIEDFRVMGTTLVRVRNSRIIRVFETNEAITNYLISIQPEEED